MNEICKHKNSPSSCRECYPKPTPDNKRENCDEKCKELGSHGHCNICGLLVQPIMKCQCKFREEKVIGADNSSGEQIINVPSCIPIYDKKKCDHEKDVFCMNCSFPVNNLSVSNSFTSRTLAEFDKEFIYPDGVVKFGTLEDIKDLKDFICSVLNAQREEAYREGKKYTLDDLNKHSSKIRQVERKEIREKVEDMSDTKDKFGEHGAGEIYAYGKVIALLAPNNKARGGICGVVIDEKSVCGVGNCQTHKFKENEKRT